MSARSSAGRQRTFAVGKHRCAFDWCRLNKKLTIFKFEKQLNCPFLNSILKINLVAFLDRFFFDYLNAFSRKIFGWFCLRFGGSEICSLDGARLNHFEFETVCATESFLTP